MQEFIETMAKTLNIDNTLANVIGWGLLGILILCGLGWIVS